MTDELARLIISLAIVVGFFAVLGVLLWRGLPDTGSEPLLVALGGLVSGFTGVVGYYLGSSAGSAEKNRALERLAEKGHP